MSQGFARGTPGATGQQGPAGAAGAGASGAHLFELAPIASPRFLGRASPGSGTIEEIDTPTAVAMLPVFSLIAKGLVPAPGAAPAGLFLRDDSTWAAAGSAGRPSGVTLSEQAVAPPLTVQGRFTIGTGTREDLAPGSVASLIGGGWGSGMQLLKAPTGGVQGRLLRDDGAWVQPSFVASGVTLSQLGALSPLKVVGRFTAGSGSPEQLSGDQIASMIGKFAGTGLGLVPTPTGGALGRVLRDDGIWVTPSFVASGVTLSQQGDLSPLRIVGRSTLGSGSPEQLTQGQVASMLPVFSATGTPGLVPQPSAVGSGMFLRDDGKWGSPTGLGNGQFALMPPSTIKARSGSTGLPEDLVGSGVATLLPLFNNVDKGLVPGSAGGQSAFLRADGVWAAPSVAAGVSGVSFAQLQDISAPRFVGRLAGSGSMQELTPLSAASMLPRMLGSGFGLVVAPTGGAAGAFLKDDGTWATPVGGTGGGPTMLAAGPAGAVQYNGGSGFAGASGFRFDAASGVYLDLPLLMPGNAFVGFVGSGANGPAVGTGWIRAPYNSSVIDGEGFSGAPIELLKWGDPVSNNRVTYGAFGVGRFASQGNFFTRQTAKVTQAGVDFEQFSGSGYLLNFGAVNRQALRAGPDGHQWGASGVQVAALDSNSFSTSRLGLQNLSHLATTDKLGAWTASGFANTATGIKVVGSGLGLDLVGVTVASLSAPLFGVLPGLVPTSSSVGQFLRDDATWATPAAGAATGLSNAMHLPMAPLTIKGRITLGSGIPEDLSIGQAASMLPPFFASGARGLVLGPTGGISGKFLQDDGTWGTPAGGASSGIANAALAPMPPFTLKGNTLGASGAPSDLTTADVASLLPLFTASGGSAGLVSPPTGGASGYFLQDDGSFYNLMPRNERLLGNIGSGIGSGFRVGSATVDFTTDPYQALNLFGRTKFTLVPPTRHRHVQLRMTVAASGHAPTFFPTMVKWMGGSGAIPGWSTVSGTVNFANFFYDGTIMWGQAGVGAG